MLHILTIFKPDICSSNVPMMLVFVNYSKKIFYGTKCLKKSFKAWKIEDLKEEKQKESFQNQAFEGYQIN